MEVLDVIALAETPPRFTDLLSEIDQPRGTLHRQISNLIAEGLVSVNADHSYVPGLRLLKLAARSWSGNTFRLLAEPHIRKLHDETGETVHLGLMSGLEVIYLDKIESKQTVRMHSQVGNASPLYCTGVGKAMLAMLPEDDCAARASQFDYVRHTETTLYTPELLLAEMAEIRSSGISYDREEHEPGIRCIAAGLGGVESGIIAGVSVTGPAFRISQDEMVRWKSLVLETARAIESDMEARLGPRSQE
ncbi:MAG: IclR family transcriptional regulator [Rhizobiaceae bacterium]|nr:IclR family transcriptional regulator [Rhizobiaceae bacterium]